MLREVGWAKPERWDSDQGRLVPANPNWQVFGKALRAWKISPERDKRRKD
jgi:hypothetical protein